MRDIITYMSKDYEKLYDLICADGEALGLAQSNDTMLQGRQPIHIYHRGSSLMFTMRGFEVWSISDTLKDLFITECARLNLEWITMKIKSN